jgi:hypothetical protein
MRAFDPNISPSKQIQCLTSKCRIIGIDWVLNDTMDTGNMLKIRHKKLWNGIFSMYFVALPEFCIKFIKCDLIK